MSIDIQSLLAFGTALQRATSLQELVASTHAAVGAQTRYRSAWLAVVLPDAPGFVTVLSVAGDVPERALEQSPRFPIEGDAMLTELVAARAPVIVLEARDDPRTNKDAVALFGNRTIINIPLLLGPTLVGALGCGTFGDEGVLAPTQEELEHLVVIASLLAGAVTRWHLLQRQLEDATQRRALEASLEAMQRVELMGLLAAGVAHDLNNYLSVVRNSLELVGDELPGSELISDALFATDKAATVTRQLLALGRRDGVVTARVELGGIVEGTMRLVRPAIPRAIAISVEAAAPVAVQADAVQVEQAIANLVLNARDAVGAEGRIAIDVDATEAEAPATAGAGAAARRRYGRVRVRDSGPGIGPDDLNRIFDPLFSTKRGGTGLGLAVVSRVAEQHGGFVRCDSSVGAGATFELYLPAVG